MLIIIKKVKAKRKRIQSKHREHNIDCRHCLLGNRLEFFGFQYEQNIQQSNGDRQVC